MRVLGIDPGSQTTGWGVIEGDARRYQLVEYGAIRTVAGGKFSTRLLNIANDLEWVIARYTPDICAVEEIFFAVNIKTALKLGHVRGVCLLAGERAGLEMHEYATRLVKQTVVGYGAAEKHQVQEMVRLLLKLARPPQPHDAADALAVAICHMHHANSLRRASKTVAQVKLASLSQATFRRRSR